MGSKLKYVASGAIGGFVTLVFAGIIFLWVFQVTAFPWPLLSVVGTFLVSVLGGVISKEDLIYVLGAISAILALISSLFAMGNPSVGAMEFTYLLGLLTIAITCVLVFVAIAREEEEAVSPKLTATAPVTENG